MKVPGEVFREYDVRGLVGEQLTGALARGLGRAVGTAVRRGGGAVVVVGRDHRPSGVELAAELAAGLTESGCDVLDIGVTPTPVGYWAIQKTGADGGVQVTGSHNPAAYNGFKMTLLGASLHGEAILALRRAIETDHFSRGSGRVSRREVLDDYVADLAGLLRRPERRLKVVVDAGNGTGGLTAVPLYERLGCEVVPLYCEPDGSFPNHHPDPTVPENLADLQAAVAAEGADIGLAFDGDADRLGVVDGNGRILWGDQILLLLSREVLREQPGAAIIGEVKCSKTLYDDIRRHGGEPVMWRTGHSLIKARMKELHAPLAGEMSGHLFFAHRYYGFDDGVYAGGRVLELLAGAPAGLSALLADVPATVTTPEIRIDCADADKFRVVDAVRRSFAAAASAEGLQLIDIDGVRVEWPDGWGLVRPSNTQPILVLRFEATSASRLEAIRGRFEDELRQVGAAVPAGRGGGH